MAKLNCILFVQDTHVEDLFVNYFLLLLYNIRN